MRGRFVGLFLLFIVIVDCTVKVIPEPARHGSLGSSDQTRIEALSQQITQEILRCCDCLSGETGVEERFIDGCTRETFRLCFLQVKFLFVKYKTINPKIGILACEQAQDDLWMDFLEELEPVELF